MKEFIVGLITIGLLFLIAAFIPIIIKTIVLLVMLFMLMYIIYTTGALVCSLFE